MMFWKILAAENPAPKMPASPSFGNPYNPTFLAPVLWPSYYVHCLWEQILYIKSLHVSPPLLYYLLLWFSPGKQLSTTQPLANSSHVGCEGELER